MTDKPEPHDQSGGPPPPPPAPQPQPQPSASRLYQAAAWVVIAAGIVFIASTIFFTGAYVSNGSWHRPHGHGSCMMHQDKPPMNDMPSMNEKSPKMGPGSGDKHGGAGHGKGPGKSGGPGSTAPTP